MFRKVLLLLYTFLCLPGGLYAEEIQVAVAANFTDTFAALAPEFEKQTGDRLVPIFGSTGKFYLQIKNGAPFTLLLAADVKHPELLESEGLALKGTRFAYAMGKIVLWSNRENFVDAKGKILESPAFRYLAIANPDVAPYGAAARDYLIGQKLWDQLQGRLIMGQDIGQTYQFVASGNAELGFVALSQLKRSGRKTPGSYYIVPVRLYPPLAQHAVLLRESGAGRRFLEFLKKPVAQKTIRAHGYDLPNSW